MSAIITTESKASASALTGWATLVKYRWTMSYEY